MFEGVWKESLDLARTHPSPLALREGHPVESILVIHQGALGDFILALPIFESLRQTFPGAKLMVMGYPRILELVDQGFYADGILSIDQREMASFFVPGGPLDPSLSQLFGQFNLLVLIAQDREGALIQNLGRVSHGGVLHLRPFPPSDQRVHLTDHLLRQLSYYGLLIPGSNPKLHLKESDRDWAEEFWGRRGLSLEDRSKMVVLHPGSGSKGKVWPLDRFQRLGETLQERLGSKILVVLGPAEEGEAERVFEEMDPQTFIRVKRLSLLQIASLMEGCRVFIGNDSGISHMASALGIPTIAIFGPTDPEVWAPKGEKVWVVRNRTPCSPCTRERFLQCTEIDCLRGIEIDQVLEGLEKIGIET